MLLFINNLKKLMSCIVHSIVFRVAGAQWVTDMVVSGAEQAHIQGPAVVCHPSHP